VNVDEHLPNTQTIAIHQVEMARKSTGAPKAAVRSSSKRGAPDKPTPTRQSKRSKLVTAKTSYVEPDSDEDAIAQASPSEHDEDLDESAFEDAESKDLSSESEEEDASEDDVKPKKGTPRGRLTKRTALPLHQKQHSEKELLKSGGKLALGTQLVIKKPKARSEGDTPYADETIHPNTMLFLKDLAANNDRQWLKCAFTLRLQYRSSGTALDKLMYYDGKRDITCT
jgi:hypothetical protein